MNFDRWSDRPPLGQFERESETVSAKGTVEMSLAVRGRSDDPRREKTGGEDLEERISRCPTQGQSLGFSPAVARSKCLFTWQELRALA